MAVNHASAARNILPGAAEGPDIASEEALSFWGGVDPATARVIASATRCAAHASPEGY